MNSLGKQIADKLYVHVSGLGTLDPATATKVALAREVSGRAPGSDFNVIRVRRDSDEIALLNYPRFFEDGFPALAQSWRVHLPTRLVSFRDYTESLNPPILHRKELLLPLDHADRPRFVALTKTAESIGLFDNPRTIGFRSLWNAQIAKKGYSLDDHQLVPVGNVGETLVGSPSLTPDTPVNVQRHLTALGRTTLSAPVQSLLRHHLLRLDTSFFDYGCGKGTDLKGLSELGIDGLGWDPYFRPDTPLARADVVNIGFVINVIEDFDERVDALTRAYGLCNQVLVASAMLQSAGYAGRTFRDGVLTSRNTFQKYYTQAALQQFLESVLEDTPYPAGPGVFYVFKDRVIEQRYVVSQSENRTRAIRALLPRKVPPKERIPSIQHTPFPPPEAPERIVLSIGLWQQCIQLGRVPETDEVPNGDQLTAVFGSHARALRFCFARNDTTVLDRSRTARIDELRVFFALQLFSKRRCFQQLERRIQRDVKTFFGSFASAESEGRALLFLMRDSEQIQTACQEASTLGLGWLEAGHALHLHTSLVERLPALLRVYVGCATLMYGDITQMDLVKIHLSSGKVTLMRFDDFHGNPLCRMVERIKVRLRDQAVDIFEYGTEFATPLLYRKSRFINEEFPSYAEQLAFDERLEELGLFDLSGFGPDAATFWKTLREARWVVNGFHLERSATIPPLDEHCSLHFKYRELVECSDTWKDTHIQNVPSNPDTYSAQADLARYILEPVVDYFGSIKLTYGFGSATLAKAIQAGRRGIAPTIDQHAGMECSRLGKPVCVRGGAAVDFLVEDENMLEVANWIAAHLPFDRLYYYGARRPIHVSYGPEQSKAYFHIEERNGRRLPRSPNCTP